MKNPSIFRRAIAGLGLLSMAAAGCVAAPAGTSGFTPRQTGGASYYAERGTIAFPRYRSTRGCAHRTLPAGTVVRVRYNGRSTTCVVDDRGPYIGGRVIDLQPAQFDDLAPLSRGVIDGVALSW